MKCAFRIRFGYVKIYLISDIPQRLGVCVCAKKRKCVCTAVVLLCFAGNGGETRTNVAIS